MTWLSERSWRFWLFAPASILILYVGSLGPACWLTAQGQAVVSSDGTTMGILDPLPPPRWMLIYLPIGHVVYRADAMKHPYAERAIRAIQWWAVLGVENGSWAGIPVGPNEDEFVLMNH